MHVATPFAPSISVISLRLPSASCISFEVRTQEPLIVLALTPIEPSVELVPEIAYTPPVETGIKAFEFW